MVFMATILNSIKTNWVNALLISSLLLSLPSCGSKWLDIEPNNPLPPDEGLLWNFWLMPDSSKMFGLGPIVDGDRVILGDMKLDENYQVIGTEIIRCYSISEKKLLWEWDDFYPDDLLPITAGKSGVGVYNNKLLVFGYNSNYLIDMETGQTVWSEWFNFGSPMATVWGGYIFRSRLNNYSKLADTTFLLVASLSDMTWKPILKFPVVDHEISEIPLLVPEIDENEDTLLYFQRRFANPFSNISKLGVYCYNLSQQKFVWSIDSISNALGNVNGPILRDSLMYYNTGRELYCLHKKDGSRVWSKTLANHSYSSNYFLIDHLLINYEEDSYVKAVDAYTGVLVWNTKLFTLSSMVHSGKSILSGNTNLSILDAYTGEISHTLLAEDPVAGDSSILYSSFVQIPVIDESKNVVYISDCFRLRCYDLQKLLAKKDNKLIDP